MENNLEYDYLVSCKEFRIEGIIPALSIESKDGNYFRLKKIAIKIIQDKGISSFMNFFYEGQYLVRLWTAHLIIDIGIDDKEIIEKCLNIILEYTNNPLVPYVAIEENEWYKKYTSNLNL